MQSLRLDSGLIHRTEVAAAESEKTGGSGTPSSIRTIPRESDPTGAGLVDPLDRRATPSARVIGHLVSLNGTQGVIDCRLEPGGEEWSVGHLITVVHGSSRLVGVVCEVSTIDGRWAQTGVNNARVTIELNGEIIDQAGGEPIFHRGIHSHPPLGSTARRIRAEDLRAIYAFRGRQAVQIGRLSQNNAVSADIDISELVARHFAVLGSSGVGKTTAVSLLIKKAVSVRPKLRVIILDPHNEYATHFPSLANVINSESLELPIWMFRFDELADIVFSGRQPHADERDALYDVIRAAKAKYLSDTGPSTGGSVLRRQTAAESAHAQITADTPTPFRMIDAVAVIEEWLGKLDQRFTRSDLRGLRFRLEGLSRDPRFRFMFGRTVAEDDIAKVISRLFRIPTRGMPITIIELAGLPNEVVNSVVSVVARLAFEIAFWCTGTYEVNVLCEEAHRYIPAGQVQNFGPARQAIGRIAKEGRKYCASLGVISQRPSELDPTVLSQCATMFAMRLTNENDKRIIQDAVGASALSTIAFLSSIADREAIAFGEAIATPMRMKFADIALHPEQPRSLEGSSSDPIPIDLRTLAVRLRGEGG
jgi:DNA helicase HerA-like ATPase